MGQMTLRIPDELEERIKKDIGQHAAETGNLQTKTDWWKDAAHRKLGDVTIENEQNGDEQTVENGGTA